MKILVFGAGAIGSAFGGFLSPFHEITLLGRRWHLDAIRKHGLRVDGIWGRHTFKKLSLAWDARTLFHSKPFFNLILVTVKSYDTESIARFLRGRIPRETLVLSLQNGIGNIETLQRFLVSKQILAGRVIFGVEIKPGKIRITVSADKTRIGETTVRKMTPRVQEIALIFSEAGLPTEAVWDVDRFLWAKLAYNAALNPLASLLEVHYGELAEHESTRFLMEELIREVYLVGKKKRVHWDPPAAEGFIRIFYRRLVPRTYDHYPSMLQDLLRGKHTEIDALNGAIVRLGKKFSVPTPFNELIVELIRSRECP